MENEFFDLRNELFWRQHIKQTILTRGEKAGLNLKRNAWQAKNVNQQ